MVRRRAAGLRLETRRPHIVILIVNLPAERDRRVIRECQALEAAGYRVTVIAPRAPGAPRGAAHLSGTRDTTVRSYPQPFAGTGVLSFAAEFGWAFAVVLWRLLATMIRGRVDAVQACNPPDIFWPIALMMRALRRQFVFDHHDLNPELYRCKTRNPRPVIERVLLLLERLSWRCATAVVATNESYREMALTRGGIAPEKVTVVRNGPSFTEVGQPATVPAQRRPAGRQVVAYLGVINGQDHVDVAVLAAERLVELRGRDDWRLVIAGDGESLPALRDLVTERGLADVVEFRGWLAGREVDTLLRSAALAIQPDAPSRMAELSTMAKTVEYIARGVPVVAVDLIETRRTAGEAAVYLPTGTPDEFAKAIDQLLGDESARATMRAVAVERFVTTLAWEHQAESYIRLWDRLLNRNGASYNSSRSSGSVNEVASPTVEPQRRSPSEGLNDATPIR